jgi:hypothetical protein
MRDVDCESVKGNMRIMHIRHVRRCMRDVDCETVKGNMRIVFIEKRAEMYEECRLGVSEGKYEDCVH